MRTAGSTIIGLCIILLIFNTSCKCSKDKPKNGVLVAGKEKVEVKIHIDRLEKDIFSLDLDSIEQNVPRLQARYGQFFDMFNADVLKIKSSKDPRYPQALKKFITDYFMSLDYNKVAKEYPNLDQLSLDLGKAFTNFKTYFPDKKIPRIYSMISGWNESIIRSDSLTILGIALDKYLGRDCEFYTQLQLDKYMRYTLEREFIVPDCMRSWGYAMFEFKDNESNILSNMLYEGKIWYFMKAMLPETPDSIIFGFTPDQLKWCYNNKKQMWTYLLEHKMLFSTDYMTVRKLIYPAPFTIYFTKESPGRAIVWVGYKIIESYMKHNSDVTLQQLMQEKDYQKILRKSDFKP